MAPFFINASILQGRLPLGETILCGHSDVVQLDEKNRINLSNTLIEQVRRIDALNESHDLGLYAIPSKDQEGNRWVSLYTKKTFAAFLDSCSSENRTLICGVASKYMKVESCGRITLTELLSAFQGDEKEILGTEEKRAIKVMVGGFIDHIRIASPAIFEGWQNQINA